ncbi:MAG: hypothetical protein JW869_03400 [Candidatus Omnitrophica bacterium]|nr:hypothetical protein [Candidatus Omnitrophota bacterium]
MKKLSAFSYQLSAIVAIYFLLVGCAQAAQVGSPASLLAKGMWDMALEGGYILERPMETDDTGDYHTDILYGYHSRSYAFTDRITFTAKVGGMYGYIYDESVAGAATKTSLGGGLALGGQVKGIIFESEDYDFEWDGSAQFLYFRSHHKSSGKGNADWYEWQIASCLAKKFGMFKPYAGIKFSTVDLNYDDGEGNTVSYDEDGNVGPFVGSDIYLGKDESFVINIEVGFLTGTEFYGGIKYRF